MDKKAHTPPWAVGVMIVLVVVKLWLVDAQPLGVLLSGHDDLHFLYQADSLLQGNWLGDYDRLTLIKGPFYPLWMAAVFYTRLPLVFAQHLLYAFACWLAVLAFRPVLSRPVYQVMLFTVLLFNPISYHGYIMPRMLREGIYPALTLIVFASLVGLALRAAPGHRWWWAWAVGLGLSLAATWLTREERIWLLPSLAVGALLAAWQVVRVRPIPWLRLLLPVGLILLLWWVPVLTVYQKNAARYGVFGAAELDEAVFKAAYGALTRVKTDTWIRDVPVTQAALEKIYAVSPAMAELQPVLSGEGERAWAEPDGDSLYAGEYRGGWFVWAFRDAVDAAGYYAKPKFPASFYRRITKEINAACNAQKLDCLPPRATLMSPWRNDYIPLLGNSLLVGAASLTDFRHASAQPVPVVAGDTIKDFVGALTGERMLEDFLIIKGWAFQEQGLVELKIKNQDGQVENFKIKRSRDQDAFHYYQQQGKDFPQAREAVFEITTICMEGCVLEVTGGTTPQVIPLERPWPGLREIEDNGLHMVIESVEAQQDVYARSTLGQLNQAKLNALEAIGRVYQVLAPLASWAALLGFLLLSVAVVIQRRHVEIWLTGATLLSGLVVRLVVLAMVDVSSFEAMRPDYLSPAYPLLLLFDCLILFYGVELLLTARQARRRSTVQESFV